MKHFVHLASKRVAFYNEKATATSSCSPTHVKTNVIHGKKTAYTHLLPPSSLILLPDNTCFPAKSPLLVRFETWRARTKTPPGSGGSRNILQTWMPQILLITLDSTLF
jgi:hypothetical protein